MGVLDGRVALVTGASSGIGAAAAAALAEAGAQVAVNGRRAERLATLARRIEAAGGTALALPGDMTDEHEARGIVTAAAAHFGRLDILSTRPAWCGWGRSRTACPPNGAR